MIYWATKHAQTTKSKPFLPQSGQKAKKNITHPEKPNYMVMGKRVSPQNQICAIANQPHGAKPQQTWDDYHVSYA